MQAILCLKIESQLLLQSYYWEPVKHNILHFFKTTQIETIVFTTIAYSYFH